MKNAIKTLQFILLLVVAISCSKDDSITKNDETITSSIDYSNPKYWLNIPQSIDKNVDVFYIYPTVWKKDSVNEANICQIDNKYMLLGSKIFFDRQATAFQNVGNIFAPYYRQVDAIYSLTLSNEESDKVVKESAYVDVVAAFDYFINHFNNGRPFIIVGHSQGSHVATFILSDYMKTHPNVYNRMIAAYVIGFSITKEYLAANPHLKFAQNADDTQVIVSYNTQAPSMIGTNLIVRPNSLVINPISWKRTTEHVSADQSLGSYLPNETGVNTKVEHYADAQIDSSKGVILCSTADINKYSVTGLPGLFHSFDINLYYYDLQANAQLRTAKYFSK